MLIPPSYRIFIHRHLFQVDRKAVRLISAYTRPLERKENVEITNICILSRTMGNYGNPVSVRRLILWTINFADSVIPRSRVRPRVSFYPIFFSVFSLRVGVASSAAPREALSTRGVAVGTMKKKHHLKWSDGAAHSRVFPIINFLSNESTILPSTSRRRRSYFDQFYSI